MLKKRFRAFGAKIQNDLLMVLSIEPFSRSPHPVFGGSIAPRPPGSENTTSQVTIPVPSDSLANVCWAHARAHTHTHTRYFHNLYTSIKISAFLRCLRWGFWFTAPRMQTGGGRASQATLRPTPSQFPWRPGHLSDPEPLTHVFMHRTTALGLLQCCHVFKSATCTFKRPGVHVHLLQLQLRIQGLESVIRSLAHSMQLQRVSPFQQAPEAAQSSSWKAIILRSITHWLDSDVSPHLGFPYE